MTGKQDDGVEDVWDNVEIPDDSEDETERDGLLSSAPEVHATAIGIGVGFTGEPLLMGLFLTYVVFSCQMVQMLYGQFTGKNDCPIRENPHLRDAAQETGYSIAAVFIGFFCNGWLIGQSLLKAAGVF